MGGRHFRKGIANLGIFALLVLVSFVLVRCGGNSSSGPGVGTANFSVSDPPACTNYQHVYVTIDAVSASISTSDTGWQTLVSNLSSAGGSVKAVQLDLMNLQDQTPPGSHLECLLSKLGSTSSLPVGDYQQIRLNLVANNASGVDLIAPSAACNGQTDNCANACSSVNAFNCVVPVGGSPVALNLSSQAQTGLKIPPGQIMGGPIHVAAGQSVDINVDFDACRSVVQQGNNAYRLDPALVGYQVSQNLTGISGLVTQASIVTGTNGDSLSVSTTPVPNANVALEMAITDPAGGSGSVDLIQNYLKLADQSGNFDYCPLPAGPFDVVASGGPDSGTNTYGATILTGVPNGTQVNVPLLSQTGGAATLSGDVTATNTTSAASVDVNIYALQQATSSLQFAVPLLTGSNPAMAQLSLACTAGNCSTASTPSFSLLLPASNPLVGAFSTSNITWTLPAPSPYNYKVEATCNGDTVGVVSSAQAVTAGATTTVNPALDPLTGCN